MAIRSVTLYVLFALLGFVVLGLVATPRISDGSAVIRDQRLTDLSLTPVLGRGYSLATNTYQSACLTEVKVTEPSYDFSYRFKEITKDKTGKFVAGTAPGSTLTSIGDGEEQDVLNEVIALSMQNTETKTEKTKHLMVSLNVDTYYASVDEAASPLAESAQELLTSMDFPGFFAACGPYYIRGITRNAKYLGLVTWKEVGGSQKMTAGMIQQQLTGADSSPGMRSQGVINKTTDTSSTDSELTIFVRGWGIGKNGSGSLVATTIEEFKSSIKDAFISMQTPLTGRATTMELVPWVENVSFQRYAKIEGEDLIDKKPVPMYRKKDVLTNNAEFMTEAQRAARVRLQNYYFAKTCRKHLREKFYSRGKLGSPDRQLLNLKTRKPGITLGALDKALKPKMIDGLFDKIYLPFLLKVDQCLEEMMRSPGGLMVVPSGMAAGGEAGPEARAEAARTRMAARENLSSSGRGLWLVRWTKRKRCLKLQKQFVVEPTENWTAIEEYCLPTLAN